ncbi:Platinum sensitivity protein [Exophiala xenobiotica]|nr:Platinum sensitivity protein [Exophiala xenobiotica]
MAMQAPLANDKKRVKVYELRDNDWFDRGTGFCTGQVINDEPRIYVESEDQPDRMLLETKIVKDDGYQKQQGWTSLLSTVSLDGMGADA